MGDQGELFPEGKRKRYSWEPKEYRRKIGRRYVRLCKTIVENATGASHRDDLKGGKWK